MPSFLNKWIRKRREQRFFAAASRSEVFDWIYATNKWGSEESVSGKGSEQVQTEAVRAWLPQLIGELEIESLLDVPCGDLNWLEPAQLQTRYIGADIVEPLIEANRKRFPDVEFHVLDAARDPLPAAQLILVRDLLVHLNFADAARVLANLQGSGATYLACTTYPDIHANVEKVTGKHHRLNMQLAPFDWPEPWRLLDERERHGKALGVWRTADLPNLTAT